MESCPRFRLRTAALAGAIAGVFLAGSAASAQSSRFTCTPPTLGVWTQKVEATCPNGPTLNNVRVTQFALPASATQSSLLQSDRADRFLDVLLAKVDHPEAPLAIEYPATNVYDNIPGTHFSCGAAAAWDPDTGNCRPAEAVFLRTPLRAWVGLGPNGAEARVIVPGANAHCPELVVDGWPLPMSKRLAPTDCFDVTVCTSPVPDWASSAKIGDVNLPLLPSQVQKIAILGDTGCRLKGSSTCPAPAAGTCRADCQATNIQACNDPEAWPFATIAASLAKYKPDLVIHVGDYSYREAYCPPGNPHCAGSPWGDNWPSWKADFFDPAAPLLAAAPWVFVRGNHEDCARSHKGWFYFLDPADFDPNTCNDDPAPYSISLPELQLLVLNTSGAESTTANANHYRSALTDLNQSASQASVPSWLLSHHPLWAFVDAKLRPVTGVLQDALRPNHLDQKIKFTVAGHIHFFEALGFQSKPDQPDFWRPPGGVFGMGGTALDTSVPDIQQASASIDGAQVSWGAIAKSKFGYALAGLESGNVWKLIAYTPGGETIAVCWFKEMDLHCTEPPA